MAEKLVTKKMNSVRNKVRAKIQLKPKAKPKTNLEAQAKPRLKARLKSKLKPKLKSTSKTITKTTSKAVAESDLSSKVSREHHKKPKRIVALHKPRRSNRTKELPGQPILFNSNNVRSASAGHDLHIRTHSQSHRPTKLAEKPVYYVMGVLVFFMTASLSIYQKFKEPPRDILTSSMSLEVDQSPAMGRAPGAGVQRNIASFQGSSSTLLESEFSQLHTLKFEEKVKFWSSFIEKNREGRKRLAALGDQTLISDLAPLFPKNYDCTTFVETVAALSRSERVSEILPNLLSIRYRDGKADFFNRNHFPEADWIPNNQKALILTDITKQVAEKAGAKVAVENKSIDKLAWLKTQKKRLGGNRSLASVPREDWATPVQVDLNYIQISELEKIWDHIPEGSVLNLVHKSDPSYPVLITHQGIAIREGGKILLRHASIGGRIRTSDFKQYLARLIQQQDSSKKPPIIGININQINASTSASNLRRAEM